MMIMLMTVLSVAPSAQSAGFDCARSTSAVERMICADDHLSALDRKMNDLFRLVVGDAPGPLRDQVRADQRQWITQVRNTCGDATCVAATYQQRLDKLNVLTVDGASGTYVLDASEQTRVVSDFQRRLNEQGIAEVLDNCTRIVRVESTSGLEASLPQRVYSATCNLHGHPIMICSNTLIGHLDVSFEGVLYGRALVSFATLNCPFGG